MSCISPPLRSLAGSNRGRRSDFHTKSSERASRRTASPHNKGGPKASFSQFQFTESRAGGRHFLVNFVGVVKVTGFTDALDDTPARKRRPTRQVRATPPTQSSVSACKPAG